MKNAERSKNQRLREEIEPKILHTTVYQTSHNTLSDLLQYG